MWASHTAFIVVHAFRINDAPGHARLATASGIRAGSSGRQEPQVDRQSEDRRCLQTISARWMDSCAFDLCQRRDDDDRAGLCRAVCGCAALPRTTSPGSNDPGRRQQHRTATPTECVTREAACAEPTHQYTPIHNNNLLIAQDACPHARYPAIFASASHIKQQHPNPPHACVHIPLGGTMPPTVAGSEAPTVTLSCR